MFVCVSAAHCTVDTTKQFAEVILLVSPTSTTRLVGAHIVNAVLSSPKLIVE